MSSLSVAAIVVSHGEPEYLVRCLSALAAQTKPISQVVVVETSGDASCVETARGHGYSVIEPGDLKLGSAIEAGIQALQDQPGWLWILHDDCAPEPQALQMLASAAELSPTVAIVGPKLLQWDNEIQIQQLGITVTATGKPFLLVEKEYDQGQHDRSEDTLAVSTAGMLVSAGLWQKLGGLNDQSPVFAQDIEFCARARVAGFRVVVEPKARVVHAGLSMKQHRSRRWLGGNRVQALSKAHVHLAGTLLPTLLLPLMYLALPIAALVSIPQNLMAKRPTRIYGQFQAWLWGWFTIGARLRARKALRGLGKTKPLRDFYATAAQRKRRRESKLEHLPEAGIRPDKGFFASGSAWLAVLPLAAAWPLFPTGPLYSDRLVPLGSTFRSVFDATGLSELGFLNSVALPSDPFNWVLSLFALLAPNNPSIALAIFVFLAPTISFLGFWLLSGVATSKTWVKNCVSLLFALSPQVLIVQAQAGVAELVAISLGPWLALFLVRAFQAFNSARSWRWVGLAGILGAMVAVSSPITFMASILLVLCFGLFRIRKLPIVIWYLVPGAALIYPWLQHALTEGRLELLTVTTTAYLPPGDQYSLLVTSAVLGLALVGSILAVFKNSIWLVLSCWLVAILFWFSGWYQPISGSHVVTGLALAALLIATAVFLDGLASKLLLSGVAVVGVAAIGLSMLLMTTIDKPQVFAGSQRQAPALVVAASEVDPGVRTLEIRATESQVVSRLIWGAGLTLERNSIAYQLSLPASGIDPQLAQLTGSLISGNPAGAQALMDELGIDFVLLTGADQQLVANGKVAIDSITSLQAAGETSFGSLWQVVGSQLDEGAVRTKGNRILPLGLLAAFVLLAIPTPASVRGSRRQRGEA